MKKLILFISAIIAVASGFAQSCQPNNAIISTGNSVQQLPPATDTLIGIAGQPFTQIITMYVPSTDSTAYGTATIDSTQINASCIAVTWVNGTVNGFTAAGGDVNGEFPSNSVFCYTISGTIPSTPANATYSLTTTPNLSGIFPLIGAQVNYPSPTSQTYIIKVGNGIDSITKVNIVLPTVTTDSIKIITATTGVGYGNVTNDGNDPNINGGFCYSTSPNPTIADSVIIYTNGIGSFSGTIDTLKPNTTYYVRAYATNSAGTAYGSQLQFTTGNAVLPTVTTDSINTITATTATGYGSLTNSGNDPGASGGFCYSVSQNPTIADSTISASSFTLTGTFSGTFNNLSPNTTYYVKAFSTNAAGTSYGSQLQFTTGNLTLAAITTDSINGIATNSAIGYASAISDGNDPNTTEGLCYSTSANPTISDSSLYFGQGGGFTGSFGGTSIDSLKPNTTYYVRAFATNAAGTSYGNQLQFTTLNLTLAVLTTDSINTVTASTASAYGNITNDGNDPNTRGGFCYSVSQNPTIADSIVSVATITLTAAYSGNLSGLKPNTSYYVRAYATNAAGTSYGSQLQFTTKNYILPTVTTDSINTITGTTAVGYGNITYAGNDPNITGGFCYSTSANPTIADSTIPSYNKGTGSFSGYLSGFTTNTTYYVKAYATNAAGTSYGSQLQFTTGNTAYSCTLNPAIVTTGNTTAVLPDPTTDTLTSAAGKLFTQSITMYVPSAETTAYGNATIDSTQINTSCIAVTWANGGINGFTVTGGNVNGEYPSNSVFCFTVSGTIPATPANATYTLSITPNLSGNLPVLGAVVNYPSSTSLNYIIKVGNGIDSTKVNIVLPAVTTDSLPDIKATAASVYGNLTNNGGSSSLTAGFCYNTSPNPTIADSVVSFNDNDTGSFSGTISPLIPNTTYYVRAYATNATGTAYGKPLQFTSGNATLAKITTDSVNTITGATAVVYATVSNDGNDPVTITAGVCYNTSPNPTIANDTVIINGGVTTSLDSAGIGSGPIKISGLSPNTTYYVRAFATNVAGTSYGSQLQFTTPNVTLPTVINDSINTITSTTAVGHAFVSNNGNDPNTTAGFCYSTSPNPTIANNTVSAGTFTITGTFSDNLSGLSPNTTYYVRGYATNTVGTSYGNQKQFTTSNAVLPTVTTDSIINITATTAAGYGNLTNEGNDPNATSGLCYSTSPNPTISDNTMPSNNNGIGSYSENLSGLSPNTTYYVKAYATNAIGTSYGSQIQFTTGSAVLAIVTTDSINTIRATSAVGYGDVTNNGGDPNTIGGFCYSTSPNPTIANSTVSAGTFSITGTFSSAISGLNPNTTYYVKAYATDAAGTSYGSQKQFTTSTSNYKLPVVTTDSINSITATTAKGYGDVTNNGGDLNTTTGFCYSTSPNPTIANTVSVSTYSITGSYSGTISGLSLNTTYYVRAYATNAAGTSYGSQLQFTTGEGNCIAYYSTAYDTVQNTFTLTVDPTTAADAKSYLWNFGDGSTSTSGAPTHTFAVDTTYNVCLTITGASGDSCSYCHIIGKDSKGNIYRSSGFSMVVVNKDLRTGITEYNMATITVYPNPSSGIINLNIGQMEDVQLNVYNILGESIYQHAIISSISQIDLSAQPNGVYFVKLNTPQGIVTKKVVISK